MPGGKRRAGPKAREKALLREARHLLDRLDRAGSVGEGRAVLAVAISKLHGVSLSDVLALKAQDVSAEGETVTFWPDRLGVELAPALAAALQRWTSRGGDYVFPGRNGAQPLTPEAVRYHMNRAGYPGDS